MEQYIKKSDLVAEIERLVKKNELYLDDNVSDAVRYQKTGAYSVLCDLRHFLETIEMKNIGVDVGSPKGDLGRKTVQVIDADGNISEVTFNKKIV